MSQLLGNFKKEMGKGKYARQNNFEYCMTTRIDVNLLNIYNKWHMTKKERATYARTHLLSTKLRADA